MKYRTLMDEPVLICPKDAAGREENYRISGHYLSALAHALEEGNEKILLSVLETIESEINSLGLSYPCLENAYLRLLMHINSLWDSGGTEHGENRKSPPLVKDAYKLGSPKSLFAFLKDLYREYTLSPGQSAMGGGGGGAKGGASKISPPVLTNIIMNISPWIYSPGITESIPVT
jgi:hypothetical protein